MCSQVVAAVVHSYFNHTSPDFFRLATVTVLKRSGFCICVIVFSAHNVNAPATNNNMNSDGPHHPPPRPPPAKPPAPQAHPENPPRPSQPPSRPSPVPPRPSPVHQPPPRSTPQPPARAHQGMQLTSQVGGGGLFSSLRGGAGSFLKNLKDTTGKVMQTVQQ